ncbi:Fc.00g072190.m01.CDS01 [Cosmosporella sp. VM-42]
MPSLPTVVKKASKSTLNGLGLVPPFSVRNGLFVEQCELDFPAAVRFNGTAVRFNGTAPSVLPKDDMGRFLVTELRTPKLDKLHDHLWLAGFPLPARPLQRQRMMGREIYLTERPDEHLVWHRTKLLLKPLPDYLLCYEFWAEHLCSDIDIHRSAVGLLLSYTWLIGHKGDFLLAQEAKLVSDIVEWRKWTAFVRELLDNVDSETLSQVDRRYLYGELRLSRLNSLTRFLPSMWSSSNFIRGYMSTSTWYRAFFERKFSWLLVLFVYISIVLSSLQVGLATMKLNGSRAFQDLSYGLTILAFVIMLVVVATIWVVWVILFFYHLISAITINRGVQNDRSNKVDGNA